MALHRFSTQILSVNVATSAPGSSEILYGEWTSGEVFVPTGSTITTLTWHAAPAPGGTYLPAQDYTGTAVTQTVAATKAYPIPLALIGTRAIKIVGDNSGAVNVSLKS